MTYTYEDRFLEPLLSLIVHFYYEVVHGPDYIHTQRSARLHDSLLCLGNLKAHYTNARPVIDNIGMNYILNSRECPDDMTTMLMDKPFEDFDYNVPFVCDRMLLTPKDVCSVT